MLSYRHDYHAGNHADVLKHAVLSLLLVALRRKDTAFFYLETHAGPGRYDLFSAAAQKTAEWQNGIGRLFSTAACPPGLSAYLEIVRACNPQFSLREYPGSPRLARYLLRAQDRMLLCELHGSDYPRLREEFRGDRQVGVHHRDGYEALQAFLPPREKRGLVLIDPAYEVKDEYRQVVAALIQAHARWPGGLYALWYPLLGSGYHKPMLDELKNSGIRRQLCVELGIEAEDGPIGMHGSGLLIINPPWKLDEQLQNLLPWLQQMLAKEGTGRWSVEWLAGE